MNLFDVLLSTVVPHDCLGCGREGSLLCAACTGRLRAVPESCYRCQRPSPGYLTCADCRQGVRLHRVGVATLYSDHGKALIWQLKLSGAQAAAQVMAARLAPLVEGDQDTLIVPVPTATGRQRQRGYDQAKLLARALARQTRLTYRDCLARTGQTHQHGLSRPERLAQLQAAFRVSRPVVRARHTILIDDVVTTGATLEAAAAVLHQAGAHRIEAAVFARP